MSKLPHPPSPVAFLDEDGPASGVQELGEVRHVEENAAVVQLDAVETEVGDGLHVAGVVFHPIDAATASGGTPGRHVLVLATVA